MPRIDDGICCGKYVQSTVRIQNLFYWWYEMAIDCPKYGWIDSTNDFCDACAGCARSSK